MDRERRFPTRSRPRPSRGEAKVLEVLSSAFGHGQRLPVDVTADGQNRSPDLTWSEGPAATRSYVLICDDPDAPQAEPFVHWVLYDIPPTILGLPEGVSKEEHPREIPGAAQGINDFEQTGYDGPSPPRGHGVHHYYFKVYAVDRVLGLPPTARKRDVVQALKGHVLAEGEIIGTYSRQS